MPPGMWGVKIQVKQPAMHFRIRFGYIRKTKSPDRFSILCDLSPKTLFPVFEGTRKARCRIVLVRLSGIPFALREVRIHLAPGREKFNNLFSSDRRQHFILSAQNERHVLHRRSKNKERRPKAAGNFSLFMLNPFLSYHLPVLNSWQSRKLSFFLTKENVRKSPGCRLSFPLL